MPISAWSQTPNNLAHNTLSMPGNSEGNKTFLAFGLWNITSWKSNSSKILSSPTDGQCMIKADMFVQFLCLASKSKTARDTKSLLHIANSQPSSRLVTRSPCDEISLLESSSTLLKLVTLLIKPEIWLSSTAGDHLYWYQLVEEVGDDVIVVLHHYIGVWQRGDDALVSEQWVLEFRFDGFYVKTPPHAARDGFVHWCGGLEFERHWIGRHQ